MTKTKKLTLSAVLCALGVVFMALGSVIDVLDLSVCALASLIVVFVYLEVGASYALGVYLATSVLSLIIVPSKLVFFEYFLVFGVYPLLKALIEKLPHWSWFPVKLVFVNAIIWVIAAFSSLLLSYDFIEGDTPVMKIAFYLLMNAAFVAYDYFITVMVRFYYDRLRHIFKRFLK
jgi:hypothetical protein